MSNGFVDMTFGENDNHVGNKTRRFKGREGEQYRVSFAWYHKKEDGSLDLNKPHFIGCNRHYIKGAGFVLDKGPEYAKLAGGPAKQAVGTVIVVWPTDGSGNLDTEKFKSGQGFQVMPWVFSGKVYRDIRNICSEFGPADHDIKISCEDTQYQKMTFTPARQSIFAQLQNSEKGSDMHSVILEEVEKISESIAMDMAQDLTLDQIKERLGGTPATPTNVGGANENVDALLDGLDL